MMMKIIIIAFGILILIGCNIPNPRDRRLAERDSAIITLQSQLTRSLQQTKEAISLGDELIVIGRKQQMQIDSLINEYNLQAKYTTNQRIAAKLFREGYDTESLYNLFYKSESSINSVYINNIYNAMQDICSGRLDVNKMPEL